MSSTWSMIALLRNMPSVWLPLGLISVDLTTCTLLFGLMADFLKAVDGLKGCLGVPYVDANHVLKKVVAYNVHESKEKCRHSNWRKHGFGE